MQWNSDLYDKKHNFVSKYGEELISLLNPQSDETILDLGCGTGDLANIISESGAKVLGMDYSQDMINSAQAKYPHLEFVQGDATSFQLATPADAIFSNATLHWVLSKQAAVDAIYANLKTGGRFVAEFGGKGNVESIVKAIRNALLQLGFVENSNAQVWYFPSLSEYASILENKGFRVIFARHFDRKTPLEDKDGIKNWLFMFGKLFFQGLNSEQIETVLTRVEDILRPTNLENNCWFADYVRLRLIAIKL